MTPPALAPAYLRQPTLHGDCVVFVSDDDLWRVHVGGGTAIRLSAGVAEPSTPCLSADGAWIAFTGRDEFHPELWLMPACGGVAQRLTWLGSELFVRGFAPDGRIVFCSNHGQPFLRNLHAYTLSPDTRRIAQPERLPLGQVNHLAFGPGGRRVIGRNTIDPARWKRYRGGTAGHLWVEDDPLQGQFRRLVELPGNLTSPMWLGDRICFVGDGEGIANLYSCRPDGSDLQRLTDHDTHYIRNASSDGRRIVYQHAAELWLFDPAAGRSQPIAIDVPGARHQAARRFVNAADHVQGARLHPEGHSLALEARGQVFTLALWEGGVTRHGSTPARRRLAQWLADGRTLVGVSDASGEERIEVFAADSPPGTSRELPWDTGRVTALSAAPAGMRVAVANHRNELWLGDVATGAWTLADRSDHGGLTDPVWSPCGGWLAYAFPTSSRHASIKLFEVASGRTALASGSGFRDYAPAFDPEGRWLYFLSLRTFDPVYDSVQFELSFPRAARPFLVALQAGCASPFEPAPKGMKPERSEDLARVQTATAVAWPPIDIDGLDRRIAAFPVSEGRFGQIAGVRGGKVVWTALPIAGAHGRGGHKDSPGRLEVFDFATAEVKTLLAQADSFTLAADHVSLLVRTGKQLRAIDATRKPDEKLPPDDKPARANGLVDLARVRISVEPMVEWQQMLNEIWRLQRDQFWVEDMSGVDWPVMLQRWQRLLPRVATRSEFSDLVWELQGELGTSHAYEMGGDHRKPPAVGLGHLAVELRPAEDGGTAAWEIVRTVQGDPWDGSADSPLNALGAQARPGERLAAIGGQPLSAERPPQSMLVNQAGSKLALTLVDLQGRSREVLVNALADETPARYREWVERNRQWVHSAGAGRVGYFHLPDMMSAGFAEFHRYFAAECDRDALIVDVRYNRGGHVSELLLEKVARRRIAWNLSRWGRPTCYPEDAPAGAVVALTNEHAGSDGDIFSHGFKLMGIGRLVGKRTWGGVIGIWPRHKLVDGTETTQPEYSFWFNDVGWAVENYGTDPLVEVDNAPQDDSFNAPQRDRQLAAALREALAAIDRVGVTRPAFGPRPRLAAPPLPPRS